MSIIRKLSSPNALRPKPSLREDGGRLKASKRRLPAIELGVSSSACERVGLYWSLPFARLVARRHRLVNPFLEQAHSPPGFNLTRRMSARKDSIIVAKRRFPPVSMRLMSVARSVASLFWMTEPMK